MAAKKKSPSRAKPDRVVKEKQQLPVLLSAADIADRQVKLAKAQKKLDGLKDERKAANKEFNVDIRELGSEMSVLARAALDGIEDREVKVEVRHFDKTNTVETVRLDTNEVVTSRAQTDAEMQHDMFGDE